MKTSRRGFLQLGAMGTAALTLGSGAAMLTGCAKQQTPAEGFRTL
ncbi:MAG: twin-arginine translocation signal domain-containing protein, partial [Thalassolituus sp.]